MGTLPALNLAMMMAGVLGVAIVLLNLPLVSELLALWRRRRPRETRDGQTRTPRLLFLVPAHDEATLITACVRSLVTLDYPVERRRVIVIADNCSDDTAARARAVGAECLERDEPSLPGKPHAIAWALNGLQPRDWDACVIVDADTVVDAQFARALAASPTLRTELAQPNHGPVNEWENWLTRLAGLLTRCRCEVTFPLKQSAGLNVPITGDGVCIGAELLRDGWQAFSLTDGWELYAQNTARGIRIRYVPDARLHFHEARSLGQSGTQRRRWLAGRLWVLRQWARALLRSPHINAHQKLDALCELGAPPPVLHLLLALALAMAAMVLLESPWNLVFGGLALLSVAPYVVATSIVLPRHPKPWTTAMAFLWLPAYGVWRASLAAITLLTLRDTRWRRTGRATLGTPPAEAG